MITLDLSADDAARLKRLLSSLRVWRNLDKISQMDSDVLPEPRFHLHNSTRMTEEELWLRQHTDNAEISGLLQKLEQAVN